ncbi:MAG: hypothetical protein Q9160_004980 [Pyrenula sp. 1 TL-2023]
MATEKPTIIIIHGAWHVPRTYDKLTNALRHAGYEVHLPVLPSMNGVHPPNADLTADTTFIRSYVTDVVSDGRTILVLMHSYGGQVGTNALTGLSVKERAIRGLSGGVANLIYMCSFALPEGWSMVDKVKKFGHEHLLPLAFEFAEDDSCVNRDPKTLLVGPGISEDEADQYVASLVRWNGKSMYQAIENCAWKEDGIAVSYILTTGDMTVPLDYQKSMVKGMEEHGKNVETVELETGHCPNLTMTQEVVNFVNRVAAKVEAKISSPSVH